MFNAFLFAFFYSRLAKCDARSAQVVYANKAIVTVVDGQVRFQVRVYDVDAANPVVEAHIRMYAVTKGRPVPRPLRVLQPDDELGGMLFLSVPSVCSHQIDVYSMLHPPKETPVPSAGLRLRSADSVTCGREDVICPICGESYGTYERWRKHVMFQRIVEEKDDYPVAGTHLSLDEVEFSASTKAPSISDLDELKEYFAKELSEVICVVEGIEPISSGTFTALQSYSFQDIVFHPSATFSPCVKAVSSSGADSFIRVDLDRFHEILIDEHAANEADRPTGELRDHAHQRSLRPHDSFLQDAGKTENDPEP